MVAVWLSLEEMVTLANRSQVELILSTIAVVFQPGESPRQIDIGGEALTAILRRPLTVAQGPDILIVTSNRDQIEVQIFPNKIDVRELSGDIAQGRSKIPRIVHEFLSILTDMRIQSYGVNFNLEINVERPREWLGNNLLNPGLAESGTTLSSNLVSLVLERPPKVWTVRFEAQADDKLNINFNASEHTETLPNRENLDNELKAQYEALKEFLDHLGL
jgi:hypothetical protein